MEPARVRQNDSDGWLAGLGIAAACLIVVFFLFHGVSCQAKVEIQEVCTFNSYGEEHCTKVHSQR